MPIKVTCEHCGEPGKYATSFNEELEAVVIRPKVIVSQGQRHICEAETCLVREIESLTSGRMRDHITFRKGLR